VANANTLERVSAPRRAKRTWLAALLVVLCALPLVLNDYSQFVVNTMLVYVLLAVSLNIVLGYLGQFAFANAGFFGVGAYVGGLAMVYWHVPFVVAIVLAGIAGGVMGVIVGLPALRVRGYYLAIVTLAFGELMRWIYIHADSVTFGSGGFDIPQVSFAGVPLADRGKYYVFLAVTVIAVAATSSLLRSRYGRAFVAVRNNEPAAASLGIRVRRTKVIAFAWSGIVAGLAGALFSALNGRLSPDSFGISQMLMEFTIVMIGGLGSLTGSAIGAVLITFLPEMLRAWPGSDEIVFSLILIVVLFLMPRGIGGALANRVPALRERLYREGGDA
jgi:branched-chain amino acid transport system permease protein